MRRFFLLILGLGLLLGWSASGSCPADSLLDNCLIARAQGPTAGQAILYPADASKFPTISSLMDVFDASGRFVSGLKADQVAVVEDGQPLRPTQLTEMAHRWETAKDRTPLRCFRARWTRSAPGRRPSRPTHLMT